MESLFPNSERNSVPGHRPQVTWVISPSLLWEKAHSDKEDRVLKNTTPRDISCNAIQISILRDCGGLPHFWPGAVSAVQLPDWRVL